MSNTSIRLATEADIPICSRLVNDWIDRTDWIPRRAEPEAITGLIQAAFPDRQIFLIGEPVLGYLSLNPETAHIGAIYVDAPGQGVGKMLIDHVKAERDYLQLNTHQPNRAAQRFYLREGFEVVDRVPEGEDGIPELKMAWARE